MVDCYTYDRVGNTTFQTVGKWVGYFTDNRVGNNVIQIVG